MLKVIFGSEVVEKILLYLFNYSSGHIRGIAKMHNIPLSTLVNQLDRLEAGEVIISFKKGTIREYMLNPRYPFIKQLSALLERALEALPEQEIEKYYKNSLEFPRNPRENLDEHLSA